MTSCTTIGTIAGQLRPSSSAGAWASYRLGKSRRRRQRTPCPADGNERPSACSLRFPCDNLIDKQRAVGVDSPFRRRVLSLSPAEARYTSRAVVRRPCPLHHFDRFRHPRGHGARVGEPPSVPDPARRRWYRYASSDREGNDVRGSWVQAEAVTYTPAFSAPGRSYYCTPPTAIGVSTGSDGTDSRTKSTTDGSSHTGTAQLLVGKGTGLETSIFYLAPGSHCIEARFKNSSSPGASQSVWYGKVIEGGQLRLVLTESDLENINTLADLYNYTNSV